MANDWPERFIYVTSATAGAAVNVAPIAKAGIYRIVEIHILVGRGGASDKADAENPLANLRAAVSDLARVAGLSSPPIVAHEGDVHDISHWSQTFVAICAASSGKDAPLVLNITAGTKAMALGSALARRPQDWLLQLPFNLVAELYPPEGTPFKPPALGELGLGQYLSAYGFQETKHALRLKTQQRYRELRSSARLVHDYLTSKHGGFAIQLTKDGQTRFYPKNKDGHNYFNLQAKAPIGDLKTLFSLTDLGGDVITSGDSYMYSNEQAVRFFALGGWLEAHIFNEIAALTEEYPDIEVATGLEVAYARGGGGTIHEFDIAVMADSQLHVVEAKAGFRKELTSKAFTQLHAAKSRLIGNAASRIYFNPFIKMADLSAYDERIASEGIQTFVGRDALPQLKAHFRKKLRLQS